MLVPWADFQLLKFPDQDQAIEKIRDLTLLSDILPTGYHGCMEARVRAGSTIYIVGAGPVGRCAAASAHLLGASCIIVADKNEARLDLVKKAGYEGVDTSSETPVPDQVENIRVAMGRRRRRLRRPRLPRLWTARQRQERGRSHSLMEVIKPAAPDVRRCPAPEDQLPACAPTR